LTRLLKTAFNKMVETVEKNRENLEKEGMELKSSVIPIRKSCAGRR